MEIREISSKASGTIENTNSTTQSTVTLAPDTLDKDENYDPLEHRNVEHPTSTLGAFFHLLKSSLGSGLLAMPAAFKNSGIVPGCIGTLLVAAVATHCVHILVQTSRQLCRESRAPALSYSATCERALLLGPRPLRRFSNHVRYFADAAMAGVCLGGTGVYVVFIASSLKDICDSLAPDHKYEVNAFCGMLIIPLVLITQIRYLKFLVPFSIVANLSLLLTFIITCYYTFEGPRESEIKMAGSITKWPLFLSTAIFAMEGINVVMPVENEMARPQRFLGCGGVLAATMALVAALYSAVGVLGYLKYGEAVLGSITLNLPQGQPLAMTAKVLVAVAVFFTYCLQMYAPMDILWSRVSSRLPRRCHAVGQATLRTASVLFTVTLAVAVPDLELLIGLVGAIFFSTLGLLIPLLVQTVHRWDRGLGKYSYILWKNTLLLVFYLIVLISGCYSAISQIASKYV